MSFICSHEAAPGFKVTALSHERSIVIWCYCLTNQYPLWENLAGFYDENQSRKGAYGLGQKWVGEDFYPQGLQRDGGRSKVYEKGLWVARCALSPLLRSGCTSAGINNAEGCCASDRFGTEYGKREVSARTHTHTHHIIMALCMPFHYLHAKVASHAAPHTQPKHISHRIKQFPPFMWHVWSFIIAP